MSDIAGMRMALLRGRALVGLLDICNSEALYKGKDKDNNNNNNTDNARVNLYPLHFSRSTMATGPAEALHEGPLAAWTVPQMAF